MSWRGGEVCNSRQFNLGERAGAWTRDFIAMPSTTIAAIEIIIRRTDAITPESALLFRVCMGKLLCYLKR